jgi:hypothetical protein
MVSSRRKLEMIACLLAIFIWRQCRMKLDIIDPSTLNTGGFI